jgi:phage tail-like protein
MPIGEKQTDPYQLNYVTANRFYVQIGGLINSCFTECSGLGVTITHNAFHEGGVNNQQKFFIGHSTFTDITLKRGITDDFAFWTWIDQVLNGVTKQRKLIDILVFNQAGETMQTWTLVGAIPVGWKSPSLQADSTTVAIEELTLAYESLIVKSSGKAKTIRGQSRDKLGYFPSPS